MKPMAPRLRSLESRIAPASLTGQVLTYADIDGDQVKITISKGTLAEGDFTFDTPFANTGPQQLRLIDLSVPAGVGAANLTMAVTKVAGGDGLAAVGHIAGGTNDFGTITLRGDLGDIDCGSNTVGTPAIKTLSVRSMGRYGLATQGGAGDLESDIQGAVGALTVSGDVKDAFFNVLGSGSSTLAKLTIGGSLIGGSNTDAGEIFSTGDMGMVKIGHDLQGGSGSATGLVHSGGKLSGVAIGGSLLGGSNIDTGEIFSSGDMGMVKISHDLQGGSGVEAGLIQSFGKLGGVTIGGSLIGGSLIGGSNTDAGFIFSGGDMGMVKIGHDLQGGSGFEAGFIQSLGKLASVTIGGSLIGGSGGDTGEISSFGDMGMVKISHDVHGGSGSPAGLIRSLGKLASVTIGGSLIGGSGGDAGEIFSTGDIGMIKIAHDFRARASPRVRWTTPATSTEIALPASPSAAPCLPEPTTARELSPPTPPSVPCTTLAPSPSKAASPARWAAAAQSPT